MEFTDNELLFIEALIKTTSFKVGMSKDLAVAENVTRKIVTILNMRAEKKKEEP